MSRWADQLQTGSLWLLENNLIIFDITERCYDSLKILSMRDRRVCELKRDRLLYQYTPISSNIFVFWLSILQNWNKKWERRKYFTVYIECRSFFSLCKRRDSCILRSLPISEPKRREAARHDEDVAYEDCSSIPLAVWPWASHIISIGPGFFSKMKSVRPALLPC